MSQHLPQEPSSDLFIAADRTYTIPGFIACSRVSYGKIRLADRAGVPIPTYSIGKRKFIDGADAIDYLHQLRDLAERQQAEKQVSKSA